MLSDVLQGPGQIEKQLTKGRYQEENCQQIKIEHVDPPTSLWGTEATFFADESSPQSKHTVASLL